MPLDAIIVRGAREHNLKNIDVVIPRDRLVVITRVSRSGKSSLAFHTIYPRRPPPRHVPPRLRHHLRRGPAPLRRVPLRLRPPVPRPHGEARRRLHRGPLPRYLHRPEGRLPQPPLHRRYPDRDLRLPPPPVRPRRSPPLPPVRPPHPAPDRPADRRFHPGLPPRPSSPAPRPPPPPPPG